MIHHARHARTSYCTLAALLIGFALAAPTAAQEKDVIKPFNGEDLSGWNLKPHSDNSSHWTVGKPVIHPDDPRRFRVESDGSALINAEGHGRDIYSEEKHGDAVIELEVMVPKGANSGIYVMGEYEVQVLDSYGKDEPGPGDMGAIYGATPPRNPLYKKPGEWQTYRIEFRAPRFNDAGEKTANAEFLKVILNGRTIHENVEMEGPTPSGVTGEEHARGPIMFQGDHGPVAYRNITIKPLR